MNIEAGSISAAIGSVATSPSIASSIGSGVIGAAPAIEAGGFSAPNIGIGPEITTLSSSIINESPVGNDFRLSDTVPLAINTFNKLNAANAVFEAESILSQAAKPDINSGVPDVFRTALIDVDLNPVSKPVIELSRLHSLIEPNLETSAVQSYIIRQPAYFVKQNSPTVYWFADNPQDVKAAEVIMPKTEPVPTPLAVPGQREYAVPLTHSLTAVKPNVKLENPLGFQEQKQEEEIDEVAEEFVVEDQQEVLEEDQEVEEFITKYLVDEPVSEERRLYIRHAITLAKAEAEKEGIREIEGWRVVKYLPVHSAVISEVVKKTGSDGSFDKTLEQLSSQNFTSEKEAKDQADRIVSQNEPVRRGRIGKAVSFEAVAKVFRKYIFKNPKELIGIKITKIRRHRLIQNNPNKITFPLNETVNSETRIEDYPALAEIFGVGLTKYNLQG